MGAALLLLVASVLLTQSDGWWSIFGWLFVIWGLSGLAYGLVTLASGEPPRRRR
jgi:hypothetical protein